ncbi:hypothetical protein KKH18_09995 [bacterium]|nr:hypothetical protein [bacterium]
MKSHPHFNRLYAAHRNKKFRNITLSTMGISGLLAAIFGLDPYLSGEPLKVAPFLALALICFISAGLSLYFHLKFLARD